MLTIGYYMGVRVHVIDPGHLPEDVTYDEMSGDGYDSAPYGLLYRYGRDLYVNHQGFVTHYRAPSVEKAQQVMRQHRRCVGQTSPVLDSSPDEIDQELSVAAEGAGDTIAQVVVDTWTAQ